jgi:hypothetical protein
MLSVSHFLSFSDLFLVAVISTSIRPSNRRGPPGTPEAEFECVVLSCESMGKKRFMVLSLRLFLLCGLLRGLVPSVFESVLLSWYDPPFLRE